MLWGLREKKNKVPSVILRNFKQSASSTSTSSCGTNFNKNTKNEAKWIYLFVTESQCYAVWCNESGLVLLDIHIALYSMFLIHIPYSKQKLSLQRWALMPKTPTLGNRLIGHVAEVQSAEGNLTKCVKRDTLHLTKSGVTPQESNNCRQKDMARRAQSVSFHPKNKWTNNINPWSHTDLLATAPFCPCVTPWVPRCSSDQHDISWESFWLCDVCLMSVKFNLFSGLRRGQHVRFD